MDYGFTEDQEMLRTSFRDFFKKECPMTLVREVQEKHLDYSRDLYRKMANLGWTGLMIPEEYGGSGGNWVDMAIFYEEIGRALVPSPHYNTVVLGAQTILALGTEEQKKALLPRIARGEITLTLALAEAEAGSNLSLINTTAESQGDKFVLNGTKLFVSNAHIADYVITVARTRNKNRKGVTSFLVDGKSPGLSFIPMYSITGERFNEVSFNNVIVPADRILGTFNRGSVIANIVEKAKVMMCAEMLGMAEVALDMAIDYSKQRVQFDHVIGSYQAIQHKMARMSMNIEGARWITYYTAWRNSEAMSSVTEMAMTQLHVGETCHFVLAEATQIHGAMGCFRDHDLTLYFSKVKANQLNLGHQQVFLGTVAKSLGF